MKNKSKDILELFSFKISEGNHPHFIHHNTKRECAVAINVSGNGATPQEQIDLFFTEMKNKFFIENIKVDVNDVEIAKYIWHTVWPYKNKYHINVILSMRTINAFKEKEPKFLVEFEKLFLEEPAFDKETIKNKKTSKNIIDRLIAVSQSTNIFLLERRVHLYFLGQEMKRRSKLSPELYLMDYEKVAKDLCPSLQVEKKQIYKAIDRLKKKGLIQITKPDGIPFFYLSGTGPADLNFGYNSNMVGDLHE